VKVIWEDFEDDIRYMSVKEVITRLLDLPMDARFKAVSSGIYTSEIQVVEAQDGG